MSVAIFKGKLVKFLAKAGLLVPTRTTLDRSASPTAGETAFNTDSNSLEVYNGSSWGSIGANSVQAVSATPGAEFKDYTFLPCIRTGANKPAAMTATDTNYYVSGTFNAVIETSNLERLNAFVLNSSTAALDSIQMRFDGMVNSSIVIGSNAYFAGNFRKYNGQNAYGVAKVSLFNGSLDLTFQSGVNAGLGTNEVYHIFPIDDGGLVIIGNFTSYDGSSANRICKIDRNNGSRFPGFNIGTGLNSTATAGYCDGDNIWIVGNFTTYNGSSCARIAKINGYDGTLNTTFNPGGTGFNSTVMCISYDPFYGILIAGGFFNTYNGTLVNRLVALNPTTGAINTQFDTTQASGNGPNNAVYAILGNGTSGIFIGGLFTSVSGITRTRLAKLDINGAVDLTFDTAVGCNDTVYSIIADNNSNNRIYVGGAFTEINANFANRVTALDTSNAGQYVDFDTYSSSLKGFTSATTSSAQQNYVNHLTQTSDNKLIASGFLHQYNNSPTWFETSVAKLSKTDASLDTGFKIRNTSSSSTSRISLLEVDNTGLYLGGNFDSLNAFGRNNIAKANLNDGTIDLTFAPGTGFNNSLTDMGIDSTGLYACGEFSSYNGTSAARLAKIDLSTAAIVSAFDTATAFPSAQVFCLITDGNGSIFVGGSFTTYKSVAAKYVVKINANDASRDTQFNTGGSLSPNNAVKSLSLDNNGSLFISGDFTTVSGVNRQRLAKINSTTAVLDLNFNTESGLSSSSRISYNSGSIFVQPINPDITYKNLPIGPVFKIDSTTSDLDLVFDSFYTDVQFVSSFGRIFIDSTFLFVPGSLTWFAAANNRSLILLDKTTGVQATGPAALDYTIQLSDNNSTLLSSESSNGTVTIPADLPIGFRFRVAQLGFGTITVAGAAGVTINSSDGSAVTTGQYTSVDIVSYAANTYLLSK